MNKAQFSIQKLAHLLIILFLVFYLIYIGRNIITPLAFAGLFSFMLKPVCDKCEMYIPSRVFSIIISFAIVLSPIILAIYFFSIQFIDVFENIPSITNKIQTGVDKIIIEIAQHLSMNSSETKDAISENSSSMIKLPFTYLGKTLSISTNLILNFFLCFIYTFLLLLYRSSLKNFYLIQFGDHIKEGAEEVLIKVQFLIQRYLYGIGIVILVLGILNSIGISLIGVDYPIFWGFLAASLSIIPYIGTSLGGLLPFLYTLATVDNYWQPALIIILFGFIQFIEGNLITPKIVGSSIKINPLVAIISMLIGGKILGVSGLILALPIIAVVRVIFHQIDFLKPVGLLLSDQLFEKEDVFEQKFDKDKFRIFSFFKKRT